MALREKPESAKDIISFSGAKGSAAVINYSVPLPSSHTGRRIVKLEKLGLQDNDWTDAAKDMGKLSDEIGLTHVGGQYNVDRLKAIDWWVQSARAAGVPGDKLANLQRWASLDDRRRIVGGVGSEFAARSALLGVPAAVTADRTLGVGSRGLAQGPEVTSPDVNPPELWPEVESFLERLKLGLIDKPARGWGGSFETYLLPVARPKAAPALFLVEVHGISAFLGDYGLGRTLKTFTLLPGEQMTISMKTWRTSTETYNASSSIIDSFTESAANRFRTQVQGETTDKKTQASTESWHAEADVKQGWGSGSAEVSGGGAGEYHAGREDFSRALSDTVNEHAQDASSKRETTVTSGSEASVTTGTEEKTERAIRNINLRHVLNFVFRELNQQYTTKIHLRDIRIGFTNGGVNTWREVPLSGLRGLLSEIVSQAKVDDVAKRILKLVSVCFDADDDPVPVLETFTMSANGQDWNRANAALNAAGEFPPPRTDFYYRFKRGPLGQDAHEPNPVDGVVMKESKVVLRTDSVVVEALLGKADALDEYAMITQKADAEAREITNERARIVNQGLAAIADGKERSNAYAEVARTYGPVRLEVNKVP